MADSEGSVDVHAANRFISSLSKSVQALCHGCMDFDAGIEIVGYIHVNIDANSRVDYVLNERVEKNPDTSMKFLSNSFLAKKEKEKVVRDGACSPVQELNMHPYGASNRNFNQPHYPPQQRPYASRGKRSWAYGQRDSPRKFARGVSHGLSNIPATQPLPPPPPAAFQSPNTPNPDINIKSEPTGNEGYIDPATTSGDQTDNVNIKSEPPSDTPQTDPPDNNASDSNQQLNQSDNFLQPANDNSNQDNQSQFSDNQSVSGEASTSAVGDASYSQDGFSGGQGAMAYPGEGSYPEGSEAGDGLDVIEIDDEDEDLNVMFGENRK